MSSLFEIWFRRADEDRWFLYDVVEDQLTANKFLVQLATRRVNWKVEIREAQYADDELQCQSSAKDHDDAQDGP